jgi:hypothetical protein
MAQDDIIFQLNRNLAEILTMRSLGVDLYDVEYGSSNYILDKIATAFSDGKTVCSVVRERLEKFVNEYMSNHRQTMQTTSDPSVVRSIFADFVYDIKKYPVRSVTPDVKRYRKYSDVDDSDDDATSIENDIDYKEMLYSLNN